MRIADRAYGVFARRGNFVVLRATGHPMPSIVDPMPSIVDIATPIATSRCPALVCSLEGHCVHDQSSSSLTIEPTTNRFDTARAGAIHTTREERARVAMSLSPEMSPREAALRILLRRCSLQILRASVLVLALFGTREASAHALDIGYLRIEPARVILDLDRTAAAQMLDAPDAMPDQLRARAAELAAKTYARELPATPAGECTLDAPAMEVTRVTVRLVATMSCPEGERTWRFPFVADTKVSATFELLVKDAASDRMIVVDRAERQVTFGAPASKPVEGSVANMPRRGTQNRSMFLIGGLLVGLMLAPLLARAIRR